MASININIPLIDEEEVFDKLPEEICNEYNLSHSRYLISDRLRIYDMSSETFLLYYGYEKSIFLSDYDYTAYYYLLRTLSNKIVRISVYKVLSSVKRLASYYNISTGYGASILDKAILDKELVMYIRNAYFSKEKTKEQIIDELNISRFSFGFAVNEDFVKFEISCEVRGNDINKSLQFMEAIDSASSDNRSMKTICKDICFKLGVLYSNSIYSRVMTYISGRSAYIYIPKIPKNVQRLV